METEKITYSGSIFLEELLEMILQSTLPLFIWVNGTLAGSVTLPSFTRLVGARRRRSGGAAETTSRFHSFSTINRAPEPRDEAADHHGPPPGATGGKLQGLRSYALG